MSDFKAKMHQIQFPLGLHPDPAIGGLQHSPSRAFQFAIRIDSIRCAIRIDSFCNKIGLSIH